ncbi:MAG TPA: hypothetical protein VGI43_19275 [Mucilaginibacter sp.]|jgi:predicted  nucleic acid-binding Zn-ribbon protein
MTSSNEICCPKCGSNQLTANKKGFSGRKAVAGAVLTGGIGLLAGTIGSNKILITCLSCGNRFKPGAKPLPVREPIPKLIWDESAKVYIKNPAYNEIKVKAAIITLVLFILFIVFLFWAFSDSKETIPYQDSEKAINNIPKLSISDPGNYQIINTENDNQGTIYRLDVYTHKMDNIKSINAFLVNKYKSDSSAIFQIFYYDNKKIAKNYKRAVFDQNTSDETLDKMSRHVIGKYEWRASDNYENLYIGKDAIDN